MKQLKNSIWIVFFLFAQLQLVVAQTNETAQLLLNVEKLAQFKQILADMKKGYDILNSGYSTIKDLSEGNFGLHKTFLDGLMNVSPAVKKYKRVADIIDYQMLLVKEYRSAFNRFKEDDNFNQVELGYLGNVYDKLFKQSLQNLDDLLILITANKLRMSDDERIKAIDGLFADMQDKLLFLRHFNNNTSVLALQRAKEKKDVKILQKLYQTPQKERHGT